MDRIEYLAKNELYENYSCVNSWFAAMKNRASYHKAVHTFEDRMWGPLKSVDDYPDEDKAKCSWGY